MCDRRQQGLPLLALPTGFFPRVPSVSRRKAVLPRGDPRGGRGGRGGGVTAGGPRVGSLMAAPQAAGARGADRDGSDNGQDASPGLAPERGRLGRNTAGSPPPRGA